MDLRTGSLLCAIVIAPEFRAQNVLDAAYIKEHTPTRRAVPYTPIREADVLFSKRVWRTLDLREKMNHPLYFPVEPTNGRRSLWDVIRDGLLKEGSLTAYGAGPLLLDDDFQHPLMYDELDSMLNPTTTIWTDDLEDPDTKIPVEVPAPITAANITRYQLKEDWFFDKQRGVMEVRIIGLAPLREVRGENGELRGHAPMFWLYFPELRYVLANAEAFNRQNDGERRSLDHVFQHRVFSSYVIKESNVYDRRIGDYAQGLDALLEADRVKEGLFRAEHDLWNY